MGKTNHSTRGFIIAGALMLAFLALAASAYASQPNIFGGPGSAASLAPNCARKTMFLTPAGKTWQAGGKKFVFAVTTVMGTQIKCLIHRVSKAAVDPCWQQAGPVPVVRLIRKDDWTNVGKLQAWTARLAACETARNS